MKNIFLPVAILASLFLTGCSGPRFTGGSISADILASRPAILSIDDKETREGFKLAIEDWLTEENYTNTTAADGTQHDPKKITLEHVGYWKWDLALFLSQAEIDAFHQGQRVGSVTFKAPNNMNLNKWGSAEKRIKLMLDILFGKITLEEANLALNDTQEAPE